MRIVGGRYRNRRVDPPAGMDARPTTDFAKEGLFNVLTHRVPLEGIRVLDLFAGTGNVALEFLSRGATEVVAVEQDRRLVDFMARTAEGWGEKGLRTQRADVFRYLATARGTFDIVFADPPFAMEGAERIPTLVADAGLLGDEGLLIVEHPDRKDMSALPGYRETRRYGQVHFSFFTPPFSP